LVDSMLFFDAENQILGRFSSVIAKRLLGGEKIIVVNSEKAVISGNPRVAIEKYLHRQERGDPIHGPFFPKMPDQILRRTIRGMLPWDRTTGRNAYRNLKVYIGIPDELKDKKFEKIKAADADRLTIHFITLEELSLAMGAKKRW